MYVLDIIEATEDTPTVFVEVRRPTVVKNGIVHLIERFTYGELETPSEQRARTMSEQLEIQKLMGVLKPQIAGQTAMGTSFEVQ